MRGVDSVTRLLCLLMLTQRTASYMPGLVGRRGAVPLRRASKIAAKAPRAAEVHHGGRGQQRHAVHREPGGPRAPPRRGAPARHHQGEDRGVLPGPRRAGVRDRRRPRPARAGAGVLRRPPHPEGPPGAAAVGHVLRLAPRRPRGLGVDRRAAADAHVGAPVAAAARRQGGVPLHGRRVPPRRDRRVALPGVPPDGGRQALPARRRRRRDDAGGVAREPRLRADREGPQEDVGGALRPSLRRLREAVDRRVRRRRRPRALAALPRPIRHASCTTATSTSTDAASDHHHLQVLPVHRAVVRARDLLQRRLDGGARLRRRPLGRARERRPLRPPRLGLRPRPRAARDGALLDPRRMRAIRAPRGAIPGRHNPARNSARPSGSPRARALPPPRRSGSSGRTTRGSRSSSSPASSRRSSRTRSTRRASRTSRSGSPTASSRTTSSSSAARSRASSSRRST